MPLPGSRRRALTATIWVLVVSGFAGVGWLMLPHPAAGSDASVYLAVAHKFSESWRPLTPDGALMTVRPPLFPMLLGMAIRMFGDPAGPDLLRVVFLAGLGAGVVALTRRWYGSVASGVAIAILVTSVPLMTTFMIVGVDLPALVFALFALVVLEMAVARTSVTLGALGGVLFALAMLTTESIALLVAVPLAVALIRAPRDGWAFTRPLLAGYGCLGLALVPWMVAMHVTVGEPYVAGGPGIGGLLTIVAFTGLAMGLLVVAIGSSGSQLASRCARIGERIGAAWVAAAGFGVYVVGATIPTLQLRGAIKTPGSLSGGAGDWVLVMRSTWFNAIGWPLGLAGVVALVIGVRAERRAELLHLMLIVAYLPAFIVWVQYGQGDLVRLSAPSVVFLAVAAAYAIVALGRALLHAPPATTSGAHGGRPAWAIAAATAASIGLLVVGVVRVGDVSAAIRRADAADDTNAVARDVAHWLDTHNESGTPVMAGWTDWSRIWRYSNGSFPVLQIPLIRVVPTKSGSAVEPYAVRDSVGYFGAYEIDLDHYGDDWLQIRRDPRTFYVGLSQDALLQALRESRARYLVIANGNLSMQTPGLTTTLDTYPGLTRGYEARRGTDTSVVYEVDYDTLAPLESPPLVVDAATLDALVRELAAARGIDEAQARALLEPVAHLKS